MKIAILDYEFIFDPSETWSNGFQFEKDLSDFFSSYGYDATVIQPSGNSGKRVIHLERFVTIKPPEPKSEGQPIQQQVKKVQQQAPSKDFKTYEPTGMPKGLLKQKQPPKPQFSVGRSNRQKLRRSF